MFHYFTIKFHFSFFASFLFFSLQIFRFASLWSFLLRSETKRSEIQVYFFAFFRFFHFFSLFSLFFAFFRFFRCKFFASLRFSNFCFEAKQSEAQFKSIFSLFFTFFRFFSLFFCFFSLHFRFTSIFRLVFAYFTFVFASDFWCFTSKWIMWNQVFFSLPSETKFSLQFQISLPKRKWGRTLEHSQRGVIPISNKHTTKHLLTLPHVVNFMVLKYQSTLSRLNALPPLFLSKNYW